MREQTNWHNRRQTSQECLRWSGTPACEHCGALEQSDHHLVSQEMGGPRRTTPEKEASEEDQWDGVEEFFHYMYREFAGR